MKIKEESNNSELAKTHKIYKDMTSSGIRLSFTANREYTLAKDKYTATLHDDFLALSFAVRDRIVARWIVTQKRFHEFNLK